MKIKVKLLLGIGLLFTMIALLITLSIVFITRLSKDTKNILADNYNTISYSRNMLISFHNGIATVDQAKAFEENLEKQQKNVTETGEKELTDMLTKDFSRHKQYPKDTGLVRLVRTDISNIMLLNMQAIQRKSMMAQSTAENSIFWVSLLGTICFLIAFTLLINMPGNIANPIKELTKSIKQIAAQNYAQRVHFESKNEFGELAAAFNTMAQKLEEYQAGNLEKLMIEKKRIETLINKMQDPVIGLDDNMRILFINDNALHITGLTPAAVIGKSILDVAVQNDLVRNLIAELFQTPGGETSIKQPPLKIYADNKESYFEKQVIPIKIIPTGEKDERLIGNVILLQNITPYKELDFAKTNFIATISHELKTPIASIKMSLQLLENQKTGLLNMEQQNLLEGIKDDSGRLLKITGELLNMAQVETGKIQLNITPVPPSEILQWAINANKSAAEQKQIKLEVKAQSSLPLVVADSEKTAWVLTNIVSNAIRYSYDNSTVFIEITKENDMVKFAVTDTGQGLAPQYVGKVFDRYFRIPGTKKEGTGLGLSISKEFIAAQGGVINVLSDLGAGSTFTILLPLFTEINNKAE